MSRYITKQLASSVAKKMTAKITDQINLKNTQLSEFVSEIYMKTLPDEIRENYEKYKHYFQKSHKIRCEGNGLNIEISLKKSVPSDGRWQVCIMPEAFDARKILNIFNQVEKLEIKYKNLKSTIEATLLSLKTYNRIEKDFHEAFEFLPDKDSTVNALAVPIEDIRTQLEAIK